MAKDPIIKRCAQCNVSKPLGEFHVNRSHIDGRQNVCKACVKMNKRNPQNATRKAQEPRKVAEPTKRAQMAPQTPVVGEILASNDAVDPVQDAEFRPQWSAGDSLPLPKGMAERVEELGRLNDEREALARMERPDPERVARLASRYAQKGMNRTAREVMDLV